MSTAAKAWRKHARPVKTTDFLSFIIVIFFFVASYLLGLYLHYRGKVPHFDHSPILPCDPITVNLLSASYSSYSPLDFAAHHSADDLIRTTNRTFPPCDARYTQYTPCEDHNRYFEYPRDRERHCPPRNELLKCLVPAPFAYRNPLPWPESRGLAWFANVPHKEVAVEKASQNWIRFDGDKFLFPGGADAYIEEIASLIPLHDGLIRTAVDTGCGVGSFGAYLMSRNIITMSFAPKDSHEAQVQLALERGVPAMIGVLASLRLPYPSRAFDMAHCSGCLVPWHLFEGRYLAEIDRILRPGGYWVLSGPPINWRAHWIGWARTREDLRHEQDKIEVVAKGLCWKKVKERGDLAIWQKPINHLACNASRERYIRSPAFCSAEENPDKAWYTKLKTCITPLPEVNSSQEMAGGTLKKWPERLMEVPPRITNDGIPAISAETFHRDNQLWKKRIRHYKSVIGQTGLGARYRNVLDMNSGLGGFAAALADDPVWVMNVMPTITVDTLGTIYERGLIGTYQDWCEAMSTYPRTYDLLHADLVFNLYRDRCEMEGILLEMDRILRPEGTVIFRDDVDILVKVKSITDGMRWESWFVDHEDGPSEREKLLVAVKAFWTLPKSTA